MSTLKSINVIHPSSATNNIVNDASGNVAIGNNLTVAGTVSSAGTVAMGSSFKRNRIINGNMQVWQRGTSGFTTNNAYTSDRWLAKADTSFTSAAQSSDVPAGYQYSLTVTGTGYAGIFQRIEAVNCYGLVGNSVTVSFWAKQTAGAGANSLAVAIYYPTAGADNYTGGITQIGSNITVTGTTSWAQYSVTFSSLPSGALNGLALYIFAGVAGSSTTLVTGVQLEIGTKATPYEMQIYSDQLAQCLRYYWRQTTPVVYQRYFNGQSGGSGTDVVATLYIPTPMRTGPTAVEYLNLACYDGSTVSAATMTLDTATSAPTSVTFNVTTSGMGIYRPIQVVSNNTTSSYVAVTAEL